MGKVIKFETEKGIWLKEVDEDGKLVSEFFLPKKKKEENQHTTNQLQGGWKPTYSEDEEEEDEEKKLRKYLMNLDKRILIVSKQDTFEGHKGRWVTLEGGQKVFIREGEMLDDALERLKPSKFEMTVDENLKYPDEARKRIRRIIKQLPDEDVEGLKKVEVKKDLGKVKWNDHISMTAGNYSPITKTLRIDYDQLLDEKDCEYVITHEIGHHVYYKREELYEPWKSFWKENKKRMPNSYSKSKAREGFAECYYYYRSDKLLKEEDKHIIDWFKKNVDKEKKE